MWAVWWVWAVAALALAILEMLVPGYIFLGFAIGAALIALLGLTGVLAQMGIAAVLAVFAVASLIGYIALRRFVPGSRGEAKIWDRDINDDV